MIFCSPLLALNLFCAEFIQFISMFSFTDMIVFIPFFYIIVKCNIHTQILKNTENGYKLNSMATLGNLDPETTCCDRNLKQLKSEVPGPVS